MAANRKLTPLLSGRTIQSVSQEENQIHIAFTDGSTLRIRTGLPAPEIGFSGRRVQKVRQTQALMNLDFEDGSTAEIQMAEVMSSVMLRDGQGVLEYAD
jgi:hypothetical protein